MEMRDEQGLLLRYASCDECPLDKFDAAIAREPVLSRSFDLEFALSSGIRLTLEEIDVEEFRALKILRQERNKYQEAQAKKERPSR